MDTIRRLFLSLIIICAVTAVIAFSFVFIQDSHAQEHLGTHDHEAEHAAISGHVALNNQGITIEENQTETAGQHRHGLPGRRVYVGLYENKPKIFTDETGQPSGIFIDILEEIAGIEQWELIYVPCEWSECLDSLKEGRIDLMPDVAFSQERSSTLDFNEDLVIESWSQVYAHSRETVNKLSDLDGKRLALLQGSIQLTVLQEMMNGFGYDVVFVQTHSYEEAFSLAADGIVDAAVSNHFFGDHYYRQYGLSKTAIVFNPSSLHFAAAKGKNSDLLDAVNRHLRSMKSRSGSIYYKALGQWMERPPTVVVPQYLLWIIVSISVFLFLSFFVIILLRSQVSARTAHLVQANETLLKSEEKYRSLFETMAQGVVYYDAQGLVISANPAAELILGFTIDEMRGLEKDAPRWKAVREDGSPLPWDESPAMIALKTGKGVRGVIMGIHHPGETGTRWIMIDATPEFLHGESRPYQVYTIFTDITERRQTEEDLRDHQRQLLQAQKMESVGRLAGGVAHDFNNLLSVIMGYGEMILDKMDNDHPYRDQLEQIVNAGVRASDLTRQLLVFSRKQILKVRPIDVNNVLKGFERLLKRVIGEDIIMKLTLRSGPCRVMADTGQLEQVFMNLAVNARDAMPEGGSLEIETSLINLDETFTAVKPDITPGEYVMVRISDTGLGMDNDTLEHIFEPFFTTKEKEKGTGLGLATSYGIIKQHGGIILVASEVGKGTTCRIYLPVCMEDTDLQGDLVKNV